jgi:hypothetical protein
MFHEIENHIARSKMSNREMVKKMTKEEVIDMMLFSINTDNREMGKNAGISDEDMETQITNSQPSLTLMMSNIYDMLKEGGVIA